MAKQKVQEMRMPTTRIRVKLDFICEIPTSEIGYDPDIVGACFQTVRHVLTGPDATGLVDIEKGARYSFVVNPRGKR